jgi:hypothetical protein
LLLLLLLLFLSPGAPVLLNTTLKFCASPNGSGNSSCCDATADAALSKQFDAMAIDDAACAAVVKSILCVVSIIHPCHVPCAITRPLQALLFFIFIFITNRSSRARRFASLGLIHIYILLFLGRGSRAGFHFRMICLLLHAAASLTTVSLHLHCTYMYRKIETFASPDTQLVTKVL